MDKYQNKCTLYEIDENRVIVSSTYPDEIYFAGIVDIKAIRGCFNIMGYQLTPNNSSITAYSLYKYCILKITLLKNEFGDAIDEYDFAVSNNIPEFLARSICSQCSNNSYLILISKNIESDNFMNFVKSYELNVFFKDCVRTPLIKSLIANTSKNRFVEHNLWDQINNSFLNKLNYKVILCGGKGTGKSTLLRYLVNKSLSRNPEILVLDLDPGQSEFTIPGCLSVIIIQQPLLGPNFSHFTTPLKSMYIGDISPSDSELYISSFKYLVHYCQSSYSQIPWFINTMGYTKSNFYFILVLCSCCTSISMFVLVVGLGVTLLAEIIKCINPSDIIQIESNKKRNFSDHLLPDFLATNHGTMNSLHYYKYKLHLVSSTIDNAEIFQDINSATKRNISTMAYFRKLIKSPSETILGIVPHKIPINYMDIIIEKPSSREIQIPLTKYQKLCCINGNLVALCNNETDGLMLCQGYGIIRGFDEKTEDIFITTPLTKHQLEKIDTIRMSSVIQLDEIVYKTQISSLKRQIPYMSFKQSNTLSQPFKKSSSRIRFIVSEKDQLIS